ncbi:odorant receptor 131-2-like [Lepisosteus oculatus]|uniref:odorant receptor 131-2-like n=1 Tax=Lepisosteus oculatus TaxID=7918 RepID=UPI00371EFAD0
MQMKPRVTELSVRMAAVQVLVGIFLYVNCLLIFTFFRKEAFRRDTRYVLFAHVLFADSFMLVLTDLALLLTYFYILVPSGPCIVLCMLMEILTYCTPLTLTAMCLERYVAICMPLRHADISTTRRRLTSMLIIWALSSVPPCIDLIVLLASEPPHFYTEKNICRYEMMLRKQWQSYLRSTLSQFYFLVIAIIIVFTYINIMAAAAAASGNNKSSTKRAQNTIILHTFQLLLCLMQLVCPFIEMAVMEIHIEVFLNLSYFDFLAFILAPRCLSPLVYGLRDEKFFLVLKYYAVCGLNKKQSPLLVVI